MTNGEQHGVDLIAVGRRLEDWFVKHFAFPAGAGVAHWPGGRGDAIHALLVEHWGAHVMRSNDVRDEKRAPRGFDVALEALGIALARLEISAYEVGLVEHRELAWLRQAGPITAISTAVRTKLLDLADKIATSPVSRAVTDHAR